MVKRLEADETPASAIAARTAPERKSDRGRQRLIDATLECFIHDGLARTTMSLIARRAGVTRGMMQYYFPTLQDALKASVEHLNATWRERHSALEAGRRQADNYLEDGVDRLWRQVLDPLHVAKQALEAAARYDADLREIIRASAPEDEATTLEAARRVYPELAAQNPEAFRLTRDFTLVFMEGLSLYPFATDVDARRERLVALLKTLLTAYWREQGAGELLTAKPGRRKTPTKSPPAPRGPEPGAVAEALELMARAQALLAGAPPTP